MVEILKRSKALAVNPLKVSQPLGAALAFLGLNRSMPLFHGSQGCTAFAKVMFVRHFREPIPLQTTAMDQISTVMGADASIIEALRVISEKQQPELIGLLTTGLSETQGSDIKRAIHEFRTAHPEHAGVQIIPVNTPDYVGSLEGGFARAVEAVITTLVPDRKESPEATSPGRRQRQVNVIVGSQHTPGDIETIREMVEAFELRPILLPDIGDSLDGRLTPDQFNPLTIGGTPVSELQHLGDAIATLTIGPSMERSGQLLESRSDVPTYHFDSLLGLTSVDAFVHRLAQLAERPVPERIQRARSRLEDAMLDCHFMLGQRRVALALEADHLLGMSRLLQDMGCEVVAAVSASRGPALERMAVAQVKIGDLEDLEQMAAAGRAELLVGNSHLGQSAERLSLPHLKSGFPLYDQVGGYARSWVGYQGSRQALFDLANLVNASHDQHAIKPYRSRYAQQQVG